MKINDKSSFGSDGKWDSVRRYMQIMIRLSFTNKILLLSIAIILGLVHFNIASAHPGRTASDGCHYCRTNCDKWGVAWNQRHCHGSSPYTPPSDSNSGGGWIWWVVGIGGFIGVSWAWGMIEDHRNSKTQKQSSTKSSNENKTEINSCPRCNSGNLQKRKGRYGYFMGCSNYPNCRYTSSIKNND